MTPPSTQNLKALDLWVFFLIYCSTFSFIPNVGFRLTLEYLTISPSSESLFSTLIHSPFERKHSQPEYITHDPSLVPPFTHLNGTRFPETSVRKTFDTGSNYIRPSRKSSALIPLVGRIRGRKLGRSQTMRTEPNPYKGMTPPSTQNLKELDLWVFFLIYCSIFSFLPNVGFRLTLEYLTGLYNIKLI